MATKGETVQIYQGNDRTLTFSVNDSAGADLNLTGYIVRMSFTRHGETTPDLAFATDDVSPELTVTDAATGACALALTAALTTLLPSFYAYEVEVEDGDGLVETVLYGDLEVLDSQFTTASGEA